MKSKITKKEPKIVSLPDGNYLGKWGGNVVEVSYKKELYDIEIEEGVRGMGFPVVVCFENGELIRMIQISNMG